MRLRTLENGPLSRRDFLRLSTAAVVGAGSVTCTATSGLAAEPATCCQIVLFSKVLQELDQKVSFETAAAIIAESGLQGVDCPVRPNGEVLPERVEDDLPLYVAALRKRGLSMPMIATAITDSSAPDAERLLRTAKKQGVQFYRLGWESHTQGGSVKKQISQTKSRLKELAAMNREIGIVGLYQNHSPMGGKSTVGGDLSELAEVLEGLDPLWMGAAFDIGHALAVHGRAWNTHFEKIQRHIRIIYCKDVAPGPKWVALGKGGIRETNYFNLLRSIGYNAPISLHMEYDWQLPADRKTPAGLVSAIKSDLATLRGWLRQ